ncbi:MAG: YgjV family protein [Ruminococcaceae bacterium]|nr:YgjV family protein [Oscillospiraceae bacterium]
MAHILGVLAVVTFLLSFQFKTRRNIIAVNLTSRLLYILQYICLGAFEGAVLDFMGLLLSFFAGLKEKELITKHIKSIMVVNILLLLGVGFAMYQNIFSLFAILGIVFEIIALWLTKEKHIRVLSLIAAPLWFAYNLANTAYGSVVGNVFTMVSIGIAMARLDFNRKEKNFSV